MGQQRDIKLLCPVVREKTDIFMKECERAGTPVMLVETLRTPLTHMAYWAQGRDSLAGVNAKRTNAGLWEITVEENAHEITWVIESVHLYGCGIDIALLVNGKPSWNVKTDINEDGIKDYEGIGLIGESLGFEWGGRFRSADPVHFQFLGGKTMSELRAGVRPEYEMI